MSDSKLGALTEKFDAWLSAEPPLYAQALDAFPDSSVEHADGWSNDLTGVGTTRDKVTATTYLDQGLLAPSALEALYHNDDVASRICNRIPETAMRGGVELGNDQAKEDFRKLGALKLFKQAWQVARLHGGAGVVVGTKSLFLVDRYALAVREFDLDTNSDRYGQPKTYQISRPGFFGPSPAAVAGTSPELIDARRVIIFPGAATTPRRKLANGYWDDSVLQRVYAVLQAYGLTWASVIHLLQDAAQGVYSVQGLWKMILSGNSAAIEQRMEMVDKFRSSVRMILADADGEKFERMPTPFAGIPELIDRISERVAAAAEMPLTIFLGSSPAGMNATGQSDLENWYGVVDSQRLEVLTPAIEQLAELRGYKVTPTYPPLWVPKAEDVAKTQYITSQADAVYKNEGIYSPDEIRNSRFDEAGRWTAGIKRDPKVTAESLHVEVAPAAAPGAPAAGKGTSGASGTTAANGQFNGDRRFSAKYGR